MNILHEIIAHKKKEVEDKKSLYPVKLLESSLFFATPSVSLKKYLLRPDLSGIIAEFKRQSPSKGKINTNATVERVSIGYMQAGASALSILTDEKYFGGSNQDLQVARKFNYCPILRKDFIIDEYQIIEAKSIGADAILLIAEALEKDELKALAQTAKSLGLEVLMEIHSEEQLDKANDQIDIIGVNNRDLTTFEVALDTSKKIAPLIDNHFVKISESGISDPKTILELRRSYGFKGFLLGEVFMKDRRPEKACADFIRVLNQLTLMK